MTSMIGWWAASGTAAIPFRQEHEGAVTSTLTGTLLVTVMLLAVVALTAWHARRRGWLDRWVGPAPSAAPEATLRVEQAVRLSPRTTLYRVRDGARSVLVLESQVNASVISPARIGEEGEGDESSSR